MRRWRRERFLKKSYEETNTQRQNQERNWEMFSAKTKRIFAEGINETSPFVLFPFSILCVSLSHMHWLELDISWEWKSTEYAG